MKNNKTFIKIRDRGGSTAKLYTLGTPFEYFTGDILIKPNCSIVELKLVLCDLIDVKEIKEY